MPITRSDLLVFSAGLAVGALAYATYPKWKDQLEPLLSEAREKLGPLLSEALAGAGDACADARSEVDKATSEFVDPRPATTTPMSQASATNGVTKPAPVAA
jgi:hypothetical protein